MKQTSETTSSLLILAACFLIPIKLSLTYLVLIPAILLWIKQNRFQNFYGDKTLNGIYLPLLGFIFTATICALFGRAPSKSILALLKLAFMSFTIPMIASTQSKKFSFQCLLALLLGQGVAAFHSLIQYASGNSLPRLFIGTLTESGQLTVTTVLCFGLSAPLVIHTNRKIATDIALAVCSFILCGYGTFGGLPFVPSVALISFGALLSGVTLWSRRDSTKNTPPLAILSITLLPLLTLALVGNLKRGPWLGVSFAVLILILSFRKRLLVPFLLVSALLITFIQPVQDRLLAAQEHFFIAGGRSSLWNIGYSLSERYPLGIGFENAELVQKFDDDIPKVHEHFHNTYLNVLVETGWIGLGTFIWWLISTFQTIILTKARDEDLHLPLLTGSALIAWCIAGFVEYNFGDSEILLVVFVLLGAFSGVYRWPVEVRAMKQSVAAM